MGLVQEGDLLHSPTSDEVESSRLSSFRSFVTSRTGKTFSNYEKLWEFSVNQIELFWNLVWDFFELRGSRPPDLEGGLSELSQYQKQIVLSTHEMPGATWFPGSRCNYAENALSGDSNATAVICYSETRPEIKSHTYGDLYKEVCQIQGALRTMGITKGDRIAAYAPNIYETLAFFLAAASLGAIWSSCSPDFGVASVIDRFSQIEPKVLFVIDGYKYGGKDVSRTDEISAIEVALPSVQKVVVLDYLGLSIRENKFSSQISYGEFLTSGASNGSLYFENVEFSHPLWILYSSGTTGLPKPIVQSHGGIVIEHLKFIGLHLGLGPEDKFFWFTTTGWMMWNLLVGGLLIGTTIVLYDGSPGYPDLSALWRLAEEASVTYFGTSAPYIQNCQKAKIVPKGLFDLSGLKGMGSTGSPLSPEGFVWVYENVTETVALSSASGGTDVCTPFLASSPWHDCRAGEIAARCLGCNVVALDEAGEDVIDEVGELVICDPMPSMPIGFWNDPSGVRYRDSYFSFFLGKWRHGDWVRIKPSGASVIYGRSDSTLNRGGVRMGTADFYRVVESFEEVVDSLVIDTSHLGREGKLIAFVVLKPEQSLGEALIKKIASAIRDNLSPRHVPDKFIEITEVPRTLSGKKMEIPVKRILSGEDLEKVVAKGAVLNPTALQVFVDIASSSSSL